MLSLTKYQWIIIILLILLFLWYQKRKKGMTESSGADSLVWPGVMTTLPLKDLTIASDPVYYK